MLKNKACEARTTIKTMDYQSATDSVDLARRSDFVHFASRMTAQLDQIDARFNRLEKEQARSSKYLAALLGFAGGMLLSMISLIALLT